MDEPTAGLHFADVDQMLSCFQSLITSGHSLIVIEHNEMVIQAADYQIELGPGAGENGGKIIPTITGDSCASDAESRCSDASQ
jgi:excinuclease ABC subunit A